MLREVRKRALEVFEQHISYSKCSEVFFIIIIILIFWPCHVAWGILVPRPGIEPVPSALEAQNLNHWTIKEIPSLVIIIKFQTEQSLERNTSTTGQPGATLNFRDFPMLSKDVKKIIV